MAAIRGGRLPDPEEVRPGLWSLPLRVDRDATRVDSTNCYAFVDDAGILLVDPGWDVPANMAAVDAFLEGLGRATNDLVGILVTHLHVDHFGLAARLARKGVPLMMHLEEWSDVGVVESEQEICDRWGIPLPKRLGRSWAVPFEDIDGVPEPARLFAGGETLDMGRHRLGILHTPGHTRGSVSILVETADVLLVGDHVLPTIRPGIGLGRARYAGALRDYDKALISLEQFDALEIAPGHEYRFIGVRERGEVLRAHHQRRTREVAEILADDPTATVWEIAMRISWSRRWDQFSHGVKRAALTQIETYVNFVEESSSLARRTPVDDR